MGLGDVRESKGNWWKDKRKKRVELVRFTWSSCIIFLKREFCCSCCCCCCCFEARKDEEVALGAVVAVVVVEDEERSTVPKRLASNGCFAPLLVTLFVRLSLLTFAMALLSCWSSSCCWFRNWRVFVNDEDCCCFFCCCCCCCCCCCSCCCWSSCCWCCSMNEEATGVAGW